MKARHYRDYVQDILDSINDVESFVEGMKYEEFKNDKKSINAVVRSIEVMGEAAKKMPQSLKVKHRGSLGRKWQECETNWFMRILALMWRFCGRRLKMICLRSNNPFSAFWRILNSSTDHLA